MNALEYLTQGRVNIELLTQMSSDNILYIGIRLRPWKQDSRRPIMYLGQGLTVTDALNDAAKELYHERWRSLDYRERPWSKNLHEDIETETPQQLDFLDIPRLMETPKSLQRSKASRDLPITPLETA